MRYLRAEVLWRCASRVLVGVGRGRGDRHGYYYVFHAVTSVETSLDAARGSACATVSPGRVGLRRGSRIRSGGISIPIGFVRSSGFGVLLRSWSLDRRSGG